MSRFYVPKKFVRVNNISISGKEAHHILDVMRLNVSDEVIIFDGTGNEYVGIVKEAGSRSLSVEIKQTRKSVRKTSREVTLIQAIPKKEKMGYITEKATELGISFIIPVFAKRSIPEWDEAKRHNIVERWLRIAEAAAKQCGRVDIPEIRPITTFYEAVKHAQGYGLKLIAALSDNAVKLKEALKNSKEGKIAVAIGPEGDFTPEEIKKASEAGFKVVNLGERVLKSDTAALAVLSMMNYEYSS